MLTDLAPDLLQHVLAQLTSACAVISTARTCSAFNAVAYSDGIWTALLATGLDRIFTFSENVTTALATLQLDL